jgi:hypothetical protein
MIQALPQGMRTPRKGRFLWVLLLAGLGSLALVASWLAPNHYPPWTSFHGESAAFAALCFFCAARAFSPEPAMLGRVPLLALLLIALVWAQWAAGQIAYFGDAVGSSLYIMGFALAWWLGENSARPGEQVDPFLLLAALVVAGAALSVFIALLQWLRLESMLGVLAAERGPNMRAYGNLGQPNHLSTLVLMATVFALVLHVRGVLERWQLIALVVWFSIGLTFAESRSALLGALALGSLVVAKRGDLPGLPWRRLVAGWWVLLLVLALLWPGLNELLYLQPPREAQLTHDNARAVMWKQSLAGIGESPWVGYGWRQSMVGQKVGANQVPGWLATDYAHNIVLDVLLWVGLPLGLLLTAVAAWWLVRALLRLRGPTQVFAYAVVVPVLVHSLFEFPFAYSYFLFPSAWLLAWVAQLQGPAAAPGGHGAWIRRGALAATLLFGALGAAFAVEYLEVEEDYRVMRFELRRVGKRPAEHQAPDLKLLTQLDELLKLGRLEAHAGMPPRDIERLRVASANFGWATLDLSYVVALGLNGDAAGASRQLAQLRDVYGKETWVQARQRFRELQQQHPQLASVAVP